MKKLRLLIIVALAIVIFLPLILGFEIEHRYRDILAEFETAGYQLKSHKYERGFYLSTAESELIFPVNAANDEINDISFTISSQVTHGPYGIDSGWTGVLARISSTFLYNNKPLFPEDLQPEILTTIAFSRNGNTRIDLPKLRDPAELEKDLFMDFYGLSGDIDFDMVLGKVKLNLAGDGLRIYSPGSGRLEVGKIALLSDSARGINDLMLGTGELSVESFRVQDESTDFSLDINNLALSASSSADDGNVNMQASYHFDELLVAKQRFGPAQLEMEIVSISAEVMSHFQQSVREMQQKKIPPQQQGLAIMGVMMGALPALLEQNPGFRISRFELLTPQGQVTASFSLAAQDMKVTDVAVSSLFVEKLVAEATASMPESLLKILMSGISRQQLMNTLKNKDDAKGVDPDALEAIIDQQTSEQISMFISQGFVEREGDTLVLKARLKEGLLQVNEKNIPLPSLQ